MPVIGKPPPDLNPGQGFETFVGITEDKISKSLFFEDGLVADVMVAAKSTVNSSGSMVVKIQGSPNRGKDWYTLYSFPTVTATNKHDFKALRRGEFYSSFRVFVDWASGDFDLTLDVIPRNRESDRLDLANLPVLFD